MPFNYLDIILVAILLLFAVFGFKRGLILELASLIALTLGIFLAYFFSGMLAEKMKLWFTFSDQYMKAIAFALIFLGVLLIVLLLGKLFEKLVDILLLGLLNKLAGALFGLIKGALYISVFIFIVGIFSSGTHVFNQETRDNSFLYNPIASIAPAIYSWGEKIMNSFGTN